MITNEEITAFEKEASICRSDEDCEFEVTKKAMDLYHKHYCTYNKGWVVRETEKSKSSKKNYKGSHELHRKDTEQIMTADILTEIKAPFRKLTDIRDKDGIEIIQMILNGEAKYSYEIESSIRAFAYVYYWIGNMLPVPQNPLRLSDRGTWRNKLLYINHEKEETNLNCWSEWRGEIKKDKDWFKNNFLSDCISNNRIKPFYPGRESTTQVYFSIDRSFNHELWFVNNTKLIIQRSYRIVNDYTEDWSGDDHEKNVKQIFMKIFMQAGYEKNKIEEEMIEVF